MDQDGIFDGIGETVRQAHTQSDAYKKMLKISDIVNDVTLPKDLLDTSQLGSSLLNYVPNDPVREVAQSNYASEFYDRITKRIADFDKQLDDSQEVGIRLVTFGQAVTIRLEDMGYWNPSLITFIGRTDEGRAAELIQHVSQINVLLISMPRVDPTKPKRPIGFLAVED